MKTIKHRLIAAIYGMVFSGFAFVASPVTAQSTATGSIQGRIQNSATGDYLNNARVTLEGTNISVLTNEFGEYRFTNVPSGESKVTVFYSGLPPQTETVNVSTGQRAVKDFDLRTTVAAGTLVKLGAFTVSASREMSEADVATNEQRFAPNMKTVLAADAFGDQTENNVAEFLKLIPAISVSYLEDHANSVSIRGMPSYTTIVTSNGNPIASASNSNSRTFEFEQLSINDVARIELNKSLLPDMPAEGIGGTVNLIMKSAFERSRPEYKYRLYWNMNSTLATFKKTPGPGRDATYKIKPGFDFTYTNPVSKNFGFSIGGTRTSKYVPWNLATTTWNLNPDPVTKVENPFPASISTQDVPKQIERTSGRISADWRFLPNDVLSVGFSEAYYEEMGMNRRFDVSLGATPVAVSPAFAQGRTGAGTVNSRGAQSVKSGTTWTPEFKWAHRGPVWEFEAAGSYSHASYNLRSSQKGFLGSGGFATGTIAASGTGRVGPTIRFDNTGDYLPTVTAVLASGATVDPRSLDNAFLTGGGDYNRRTTDVKKSFRLNGRRTLDLAVPITVKAGGDVRQSLRDRRQADGTYTFVGPDGIANTRDDAASLYDLVDRSYSTVTPPFGNPKFVWGDMYKVWDLIVQHPGWFTRDAAAERNTAVLNSAYTDEAIASGFLRLDGSFFRNRLGIAGGVRFQNYQVRSESGEVDTLGRYLQNDDGELVINPATGQPIVLTGTALQISERTNIDRGLHAKRTVRGFYPSINVVYRLTESLHLRGNVANSINYPELSQITGVTTISDITASVRRITANKPLEPWTAHNYDIDLEYYTQNGGAITLAFFRKDISNFIRQTTFRAGTPEAKVALAALGYEQLTAFNYEVVQKYNEGKASLSGWEFGADQRLDSYTPAWARGLRVFANTSYKAAPSGVGTADLGAFSQRLFNWGVSYRRGPFGANLKWNYVPEQKLIAPDPAAVRPNSQTYLDIDVSYQLHAKMSLFASATNVTGVLRTTNLFSNNTPDYARRRQVSYSGVAIVAGVKGQF